MRTRPDDSNEQSVSRSSLGTAAKSSLMPKYSWHVFLALFLFISMLGWIFEIALYLFNDNVLINPGVLHGPWVPIYGACCVLILALFSTWEKKPVALFFLIMLLCGVAEFLTGNVLELLTGVKWWDYSNFVFNIGGYVCLEALVTFGVFGLFLVYVLAPSFEKWLTKAPKRALQIVLGLVLSVFIVDMVYSFISPNLAAPLQNSLQDQTEQH